MKWLEWNGDTEWNDPISPQTDAAMDFILTLKLKPTPNPVLKPRIPSTPRVLVLKLRHFTNLAIKYCMCVEKGQIKRAN